jgi:endoglucanase
VSWPKSSHTYKLNPVFWLLLPAAAVPQDGNGLWFTERWTEQQWLDSWSIVAKRYANNSAVAGVGLRNEPRPTLAGRSAAAAVALAVTTLTASVSQAMPGWPLSQQSVGWNVLAVA